MQKRPIQRGRPAGSTTFEADPPLAFGATVREARTSQGVALDARVVSEGANLIVTETKSAAELLFRQQVGGAWLASPIQVYLDLLRGEGRAKEMAEHLRRERIGF